MNLQDNIKRILREETEIPLFVRRRFKPEELEWLINDIKELIEFGESLDTAIYDGTREFIKSRQFSDIDVFGDEQSYWDSYLRYERPLVDYVKQRLNIQESIRRTLKESVQELLKYRKLFNDLKLPEEGLVINNKKLGITNLDNFFWDFVDLADYKSDNDYKRIHTTLMDLYTFVGVPAEKIMVLEMILKIKCKVIDDKWGEDIRNIGDDSWSDLRADIVSRGKSFYLKALTYFDLVQTMANEDDYNESFFYSIPYQYDLI